MYIRNVYICICTHVYIVHIKSDLVCCLSQSKLRGIYCSSTDLFILELCDMRFMICFAESHQPKHPLRATETDVLNQCSHYYAVVCTPQSSSLRKNYITIYKGDTLIDYAAVGVAAQFRNFGNLLNSADAFL